MISKWIFLLFTFLVEGDKIMIEVTYPGEMCADHVQYRSLQPTQRANSLNTKGIVYLYNKLFTYCQILMI